MVRQLFLTICLLCCGLAVRAQQTLNIYTTTQGVVSFVFADKPEMTFPTADMLTVTSEKMTVEFPYSELEKITFEDAPDAVASLTVQDGAGPILIYDLSGKLLREVKTSSGSSSATINLSTLRPGVYVVKDGKRSMKLKFGN